MQLSDFRLRLVGPEDAATVAAHRFPDPWGDETRLAQMRSEYAMWLRELVAESRYVGWFAEAGGQVVSGAGAVLLDWGPTWVDPNPVKARLANVFTVAGCRRLGLARKVVTRTLETLRDRGIQSVSLASTDVGQGLYASLGFEPRSGEFGISLA